MLSQDVSKSPCDLILFGCLGDLSCRKLLPALYQLECADLLHSDTQIIACAKEILSTEDYKTLIKNKIQDFIPNNIDEHFWQRFSNKLTYCRVDVTDTADFKKLKTYLNPEQRTLISYFAIAPSLYTHACEGLFQAGLTQYPARVVLEKPIGDSLGSSQKINDMVGQYFSEEQIYRIDHYLGKETVLNLLVLRFANSIFSANWDNQGIEKVEITVAEEIGVEGRWDYYNKAGQVKDMLQNHLLQILSLIAMEPPLSLSAENIATEKLKVLKSLRPINLNNVHDHSLRAQYTSNEIKGKKLPGYLEEGSFVESNTETLVAIKAFIDNWRWSGVPFYLLTGKRLPKKQSKVVIHFKSQPFNIFKPMHNSLSANQLIIRLQPDEGVEVRIMNKVPGLGKNLALQENKLDLNFNTVSNQTRIADAYERLLLEIMLGNQYLFVSRNEIEQAWQWIDDIIDAWHQRDIPLYTYPSGTWGPKNLVDLFSSQSHIWEEDYATS
ncbi:glucose-6-phosphate dehydrogenase [Legionella sp. km772]|uniref:glucose-6-phosphate dehydrogenase n=1 Tax=Legionella sp. km772 TaxID=2498111 RepID=UPI000F8EAD03|nr:glucose-6-phosphate dehydrogenase [Legionella sp. km772]RUR11652.1 glucose-6-phosphate dehydrogenase [Legionella sp. km772]